MKRNYCLGTTNLGAMVINGMKLVGFNVQGVISWEFPARTFLRFELYLGWRTFSAAYFIGDFSLMSVGFLSGNLFSNTTSRHFYPHTDSSGRRAERFSQPGWGSIKERRSDLYLHAVAMHEWAFLGYHTVPPWIKTAHIYIISRIHEWEKGFLLIWIHWSSMIFFFLS